ncbi:MAG: PIN domain-containing protein [Campylobacterales bacterium]|nr:PIN domain-containing protein [Campylobacterales bacterium]
MVHLLDTNIIIRFLIGDHEDFLLQSTEIFKNIETSKIQVEIGEGVLMEAYFVLTKFYKISKTEVINDLKTILAFDGVINHNKAILFETFSILENKNIDFVDALICAKSKLQGYGKLSFDNDLKRC